MLVSKCTHFKALGCECDECQRYNYIGLHRLPKKKRTPAERKAAAIARLASGKSSSGRPLSERGRKKLNQIIKKTT